MTDELYIKKLEKQNEQLKKQLKEKDEFCENFLEGVLNSITVVTHLSTLLFSEYRNDMGIENEDSKMDVGTCILEQLRYGFLDKYNTQVNMDEIFIDDWDLPKDYFRTDKLFSNEFVVAALIRSLKGFFLGGDPEQINKDVEDGFNKILGNKNFKKLRKIAQESEIDYGSCCFL